MIGGALRTVTLLAILVGAALFRDTLGPYWTPAIAVGGLVILNIHWAAEDAVLSIASVLRAVERDVIAAVEKETRKLDPNAIPQYAPAVGIGVWATGRVKWFSDVKGYGFIAPDDGGKDIFITHVDIDSEGFRTLSENDLVEYEQAKTAKGPGAAHIRKVG